MSINLKDTDPMPFGEHKDKPMEEVPASYLLWLYDQGIKHNAVRRYVEKNMNFLQQEEKQES